MAELPDMTCEVEIPDMGLRALADVHGRLWEYWQARRAEIEEKCKSPTWSNCYAEMLDGLAPVERRIQAVEFSMHALVEAAGSRATAETLKAGTDNRRMLLEASEKSGRLAKIRAANEQVMREADPPDLHYNKETGEITSNMPGWKHSAILQVEPSEVDATIKRYDEHQEHKRQFAEAEARCEKYEYRRTPGVPLPKVEVSPPGFPPKELQ